MKPLLKTLLILSIAVDTMALTDEPGMDPESLARQQAQELYNQAVRLADEGELAEALKLYNKVVQENPYFEFAIANRGVLYLELEQPELARRDFYRALILDPSDLVALNGMGKSFLLESDFENAIATYTQALKTHPNHPELLKSRGHCHAKLGNLTAAIRDTQQALKQAPTDVELYTNLIIFHARTGHPNALSKIEHLIAQAKRIDPNHPKLVELLVLMKDHPRP